MVRPGSSTDVQERARKGVEEGISPPAAPFTIIEDNDPTGYKSRAGKQAKMKANIVVDSSPKRSPDLNVLDYSLWSEINRHVRAQERSYCKSKKETKEEFKKRRPLLL